MSCLQSDGIEKYFEDNLNDYTVWRNSDGALSGLIIATRTANKMDRRHNTSLYLGRIYANKMHFSVFGHWRHVTWLTANLSSSYFIYFFKAIHVPKTL